MTRPAALSNLLRSKGVVFILLLGNIALGSTIAVQDHIIEAQKSLIRMLFQDAAELTTYRMASVMAKTKKP